MYVLHVKHVTIFWRSTAQQPKWSTREPEQCMQKLRTILEQSCVIKCIILGIEVLFRYFHIISLPYLPLVQVAKQISHLNLNIITWFTQLLGLQLFMACVISMEIEILLASKPGIYQKFHVHKNFPSFNNLISSINLTIQYNPLHLVTIRL